MVASPWEVAGQALLVVAVGIPTLLAALGLVVGAFAWALTPVVRWLRHSPDNPRHARRR